MSKIKTLPRKNMRNGVHFSVDEAFLAKLKAAAFTQTRLTALITDFEAAFADEDKYLQMSRASELTAQLAQADDERDKLYSLVKQTVASWLLAGIDPQATAAKALQTVVDTYKIDVNAQYDQETGLLTNFLTDTLTDTNAAHLETLGLTDAVTLLKERNELVKTLLASRSEERGAQTLGALKIAREKCDEIYSEIVSVIESCSVLMDDTEPYETFISEWNAEVERIKQQLKRKGSSASTTTATTTGETA